MGVAMSTSYESIGPAALQSLLAAAPTPLLLDVRSADEFARGHLAGARHIPLQELTMRLDEVRTGQPVVVYCVFGHEVGQSTAVVFKAKGIDATFLVGGIHDWVEAGRPVEAK